MSGKLTQIDSPSPTRIETLSPDGSELLPQLVFHHFAAQIVSAFAETQASLTEKVSPDTKAKSHAIVDEPQVRAVNQLERTINASVNSAQRFSGTTGTGESQGNLTLAKEGYCLPGKFGLRRKKQSEGQTSPSDALEKEKGEAAK